jgi:hypothetical protein
LHCLPLLWFHQTADRCPHSIQQKNLESLCTNYIFTDQTCALPARSQVDARTAEYSAVAGNVGVSQAAINFEIANSTPRIQPDKH